MYIACTYLTIRYKRINANLSRELQVSALGHVTTINQLINVVASLLLDEY